MRKKTTPKRKPMPADSLLKTSKKRDIELTEKEGTKAAGAPWSGSPQSTPQMPHSLRLPLVF
jgi:hypothetical protein